MLDTILSIVAPHHCSGCGKIGHVLCANCKYNITSERYIGCVVCEKPCGDVGICKMCRPGFSRAWCVAAREGTVERVIDSYKFDRARSAYRDIADVLDMVVPVLPGNVVVVPVPTIARHIRQRGYDHTLLIARYFAKKRQLELNTHSLMRVSNTSQFGASKKQRELQAQRAFASTWRLDGTKTYLLVDDIYTTGATLRHAARILKDAGAGDVWVAVVAKQTLVKS